jgi:hypothetical protein
MSASRTPGVPGLRSLRRRSLPFAALLWAMALVPCFAAEPAATSTSPSPVRSDAANADVSRNGLKPGEFPPSNSGHRTEGTLLALDYVHRSGVLRDNSTGELVDFTMPPFGGARYLGAQSDLRDIPLGIHLTFLLNQDESGAFSKVAELLDDFTAMASRNATYRLDEAKVGDGVLIVSVQDPGRHGGAPGSQKLQVDTRTRVWKDGKPIKLGDLAVGDALLANRAARTAAGLEPCVDIWVGAETQQRATEVQRARQRDFLKLRGLPGWVDRADSTQIVVTLFSTEDRSVVKALFNEKDFPVGKDLLIATTNRELRTYDANIDGVRAQLIKVEAGPLDCPGCSGIRLVLKPFEMLEGFRPGGLIRIINNEWPVKKGPADPLFGEALGNYHIVHSPEVLDELANQFPFRTDFGNEQLPWYQLQSGVTPPPSSEHLVLGELVKVDTAGHAGQFRADRTGNLVSFTLLPQGGYLQRVAYNRVASPVRITESVSSVLYLDAEATLSDIPLGTRCRFQLYQDGNHAFTQVALMMDEYTRLALNHVQYRIEDLRLDAGRLQIIRHLPHVKNYHEDIAIPLDLGRAELTVDAATRVWKGAKQVTLADLSVGDELLINLSGQSRHDQGRCTDLWVGEATQKLVTDTQMRKSDERAKAAKKAAPAN